MWRTLLCNLFLNNFLTGFIQEEKDEDSAPLMVLEFMQYGDLASFMTAHRYEINWYPCNGAYIHYNSAGL